MRKLAVIAVVVSGFIVPAVAQTPDQDLRSCDGGNQPREDRIAACTRLIDAGDRAATELTWIHDRRGDLLYGEEDYEAALADYAVVAELDPSNWEPHAARGLALLQLERDEEAVAAYDRAIELNPRVASSFYRRGLAYRFLDKPDLALRDYDQAIALDPNFPAVLLGRGSLHLSQDRFAEALADFSVALELAPYDARTYAGRGQTSTARAIRPARSATTVSPNCSIRICAFRTKGCRC